ncbi:guanylate kinase [Hyphomicrobium sp. DY-1]|uniref:guanylate kinase n=1 Tax=Hyphomicrobium sp. DY-1 TaxID=3075650 RepID=UPI0039C4C159
MSKSAEERPSSTAVAEPHIARRGLLYIVSSPSGAGKTTLARRVLEADANVEMSVSVTTRAPRPGEQNGVDYHFVDHAAFERMKERDELLEWARVFDNYYGTPRAPVEAAIRSGKDVLFDIDWQGAQQLSEKMPGDVVRVFVLPPSGNVLEERLKTRAQDPPDIVAKRMAAASSEISHWPEYDYVIVNAHVEASVASALAILTAERLKRGRLLGLSEFVRTLQVAL